MKRLILFTSITHVIFALLCGTAILFGKSQPQPIAQSLDFCDGMPCYMGLVLNHTTEDEAKRVLSRLPSAIFLESHYFARPSTGYFQSVDVLSHDGVVIEIVLAHTDSTISDDTSLSAGLVLNALGAPCAVYSLAASSDYQNPHLVVLSYSDRLVYAITDQWYVKPDSLVGEVDLFSYHPQAYSASQKPCHLLSGYATLPHYRWQGFHQYPPK
jgi:hypothetical protein